MKLRLLLIILSTTNLAFAQGKYDANWCFGIKAGINFNDTVHPVNFNTLCDAEYTTACISDSSGKLLFYIAPDTPFIFANTFDVTNAIYDDSNKVISNGASINVGIDYTDGLILPVPGQKDSYCFFYLQRIDSVSYNGNNQYDLGNLAFSKIVKVGNSYAVVNPNQVLSGIPTELRLTAVRHANGNDWWLVLHQSEENIRADSTNAFIEYLVTSDSVLGPYTQSIGSVHNSWLSGWEQLVFSKDGNWLACTLGNENAVDLFNFDRCTGQLKDYIPLTNIDSTGKGQMVGCAFSANSTKLYVSEGFRDIDSISALYQYSVDMPEIESSKIIIWQSNNPATIFGGVNLAPDNKIYVSVGYNGQAPYHEYNQYNQYLWVVESPDSSGVACNFQPYGYYLGDSARVYLGLVNMPNYNLGALSIYEAGAGVDTTICSTDTNTILIGLPSVIGVTYSWQSAAGITDITQAQQLVKPSQSTWYYVTLTDTTIQYSCQSRTDSVYVGVKDCTSGIQNFAEQAIRLNIYPNPADDYVIANTDASFVGDELDVLNLMGEPIEKYTILNSKFRIPVAALPEGLYLIKISDSDGRVGVAKFVKE